MTYEEIALLMHARELEYERQIPHGHWVVLRLDGRNFSSLTEQHYTKPFDATFRFVMEETTRHLLAEFYGVYAYVASDEISLLISPPWEMFERRLEKITTLAASCASVFFSQKAQLTALFDARALSLHDFAEVSQYFDWRLGDVERCALQTMTYWTLRHQQMSARQATTLLKGLTVSEKRDLLLQCGIDYDTVPTWQRRGAGFYWETYEKEGYNPIAQQVEMAARRRITHFDDFQSRSQYREWLHVLCEKEAQP